MGYYYTFYRPWDMQRIADGKYSGMPFFNQDVKTILFPDDAKNCFGYGQTGIMDREMALSYQKTMTTNQTFFTDLMDENGTDCLIYRIT